MTVAFDESAHLRATSGEFASQAFSAPEIELQQVDVNPFDYSLSANNPETTTEELHELAELDNWMIYMWIARHPNIGEDAQMNVIERGEAEARLRLARNAAATPSVLFIAATDATTDVRVAAAGHLSLHEFDQMRLARDPSRHVRAALAANPRLSDSAAAMLRAMSGIADEKLSLSAA